MLLFLSRGVGIQPTEKNTQTKLHSTVLIRFYKTIIDELELRNNLFPGMFYRVSYEKPAFRYNARK